MFWILILDLFRISGFGFSACRASRLVDFCGEFMSAQKYRLQPVLDKREKKKKDAEKILADARAEVERQKQISSSVKRT